MEYLNLGQVPMMKLQKLKYSCDMSNKVFEHIRGSIMKHEFVSVNIHRHKDGLDIEVNIL